MKNLLLTLYALGVVTTPTSANCQARDALKDLRSVAISISYSTTDNSVALDTAIRTSIELALRRDGIPSSVDTALVNDF